MKKLLLFLFLSLNILISTAQGLSFGWAKGMGSTSNDEGYSVAVDAAGNVYTTGYFQGTADFDPGVGVSNLIASGNFDIFISKLDAAGNFVWAKSVGNASTEVAYSISLDAANNVYVTGYFYGTIDFDPGVGVTNLVAAGSSDIFILKLDVNGNFVWAKNIGGASFDYGSSLTLDATGTLFISGSYNGTVDFDPGPGIFNLLDAGSGDGFILKLDAIGNFVWAKKIGGAQGEGITSLNLDGAGNIYGTGQFYGMCDFDPGPGVTSLSSSGQSDIFVLKLDATGSLVWVKSMGGSFFEVAAAIAVDATGNVYTIGSFQSGADFDPGVATYTLNFNGFYDCFISKLDASGNFVWAKSYGSPNQDQGMSIATDVTGNVYATGFFQGAVDFDPSVNADTLYSNGAQDIFIIKLDPPGNLVWAANIGGISSDQPNSIFLDSGGSVYLAGYTSDTLDCDPGIATYTLSSNGGEDVFLLKLMPCSAPATPTNSTPISNQTICTNSSTSLNAIGTGTINWFASPTSTSVLGSGTTFITPTLSAGVYTFYAEAFTCTNSVNRTSITVTVSICLGIQSVETPGQQTSIVVYPNPTNGDFTISTNAEMNLSVVNALGEVLADISTNESNNYKMLITDLPSGVYFVIGKGNYPTVKQKIMVVK